MITKRVGPVLVEISKRPLRIYTGFHLMYATKGSGPVLKETPKMWTYVNGFIYSGSNGHVIFSFRRNSR